MPIAYTRCECHIAAFPLDVFSAISLWLTPAWALACPRRWNNFSKGLLGHAPGTEPFKATGFNLSILLHLTLLQKAHPLQVSQTT